MITIKLPYKTSLENIELIGKHQIQYSSLLRIVYNRKKEGMSIIDIRKYVKNMKNLDLVDSWFFDSATYWAKSIINRRKNEKVIFGSKKQFVRKCKNLITKEEWKERKLLSIYSIGQSRNKGNRKFNLDIINNNQIIFKPSKKNHIVLDLPNLKPNIQKQLFKLEERANNFEIPYTVELNKSHIFLIFEEFKNEEKIEYKQERFLSIDLNPGAIGISITEHKNNEYKIIHTQEFNFLELLNKCSQNKLNFELLELSKTIINISNHFKCKYVFIENLTIKSKDHKKGKSFNKLINNKWNRSLLINNLRKRCNINGIKIFEVNPAHSSYIGNLQYNYSDPINASIEIGRRGYEIIILRNKDGFYPMFKLKDSILHQWKETDVLIFDNWKGLCNMIKNSKLRYRVPIGDVEKHHKVFRQEYNKPIGIISHLCV